MINIGTLGVETWFRMAYIQGEGIGLEPFTKDDAAFELAGYVPDGNEDEVIEEYGDGSKGAYAEKWVRVKDGEVDQFTTQEARDLLVDDEE
jgi:hypothetical protein